MRTSAFKSRTWRRAAIGLLALLVLTPVAAANGRHSDAGGHRDKVFYITGTAKHDRDPENPVNQVLRLTSAYNPANPAAAQHGAIARVFDRKDNVKVWQLDNLLENKHRFETGHSCGVGSPRYALAIDRDGDGDSDGNAFGYFGTSPAFAGCPMETWLYEDYTGGDGITGLGPAPSGTIGVDPSAPPPHSGPPNEELEWDLTQFGGPFYNTWSMVETYFSAYPHHKVCAIRYVDDFGAPPGTGHADLIVMGNAVWDGWEDTAGRSDPFAHDPCKFKGRGHDDDDDDDDDDDSDDD